MRQNCWKAASGLPWLQGKHAPAMSRSAGCTETLVKWSEGLRICSFKCHLRESQSPQMVSGMFRETKFSAAGWTLLGKGIGLRVSAKAVVTFAGMYVVHGKATVQSTPPPPPPFTVLELWLCSQHRIWIFCKYCSHQNLLVPELQNSFPNCIAFASPSLPFPQAGWLWWYLLFAPSLPRVLDFWILVWV